MKRKLHLYHFHTFCRTLRKQLQLLAPGKDIGYPLIYHVELYTADDGNASRESGVRSPRVLFMIGLYGIIRPFIAFKNHIDNK